MGRFSCTKRVHSGASIDRVRGIRILYEVHRRGQWRALRRIKRYNESSCLAVDCHFVPRTLRDKLGTRAQRAEVSLTKRLQIQLFTNA